MPSDSLLEGTASRTGLVERLAELAVAFGANLQPGQILGVSAETAHHTLVRAIAVDAYRRGARFVDVRYFDPHAKRARIAYADEETLDFVPSWYGERLLGLGEARGALVAITGPSAPGLLEGLDPARAGRDLLPWVKEVSIVVSERTVNWSVVPYPTPAWATLVHPEVAEEEALDRLWQEVAHVCRLDEEDPVEAWGERIAATDAAAARLNERRFDALRFEGPGTDVTVGLLPSSMWTNARFTTLDGIRHLANIPTEEVFTTPDPERTHGVVRSTKPLVMTDGSVIRGLRVGFENGRAISVDADEGAEVLRGQVAKDTGAARLGEVALVDRHGRIGALGTTFYDTLLDENAASHVALGSGFHFAVDDEDRARVNDSAIHVDFMIGADDVDVTGITPSGERVPVLRGGDWAL